MTEPVLRLEKRINADPTRLFRAWLSAEDLSKWFLPEDAVNIQSATLDPKPGGKFLINMVLNGKVLPHEGEYREIDEPKKLVFTWKSIATGGRDTLVTITFDSIADPSNKKQKPQTLVTLIHERLASEEIESHRNGWTGILNGLEIREGIKE